MSGMIRLHRDKLLRVIRMDDIIVLVDNSSGNGELILGRVTKVTSKKQIWYTQIDTGLTRRCYPSSVVVISQQVEDNISGNVGAGIELQTNRETFYE